MFYCLEGIDGAGKTSAARAVVRALESRGEDPLLVRKSSVLEDFPEVAVRLRAIGRGGWDPALDARTREIGHLPWILYNAAYYAALASTLVEPALTAGRPVVVDGWFYKFALRAAAIGWRSLDEVLDRFAGIRSPDPVFLLDLAPAVAAARLTGFTENETGNGTTGEADEHAAFVAFQTGVRRGLLALAGRYRWTVLDGQAGSPGVVAERALALVHQSGRRQAEPDRTEAW